MAAQVPSNAGGLCEKCFSSVETDATFCPECGAPLASDGGPSTGSDAAIYPELARANLLRMRGEFKMAEDVCRAILRRYPNNTTASALLGDIAAEQGDLEDAIRWYELVLDIVPGSSVETAKLEALQKRLEDQQAKSTAQHLGIPTKTSQSGLFAVLAIAFVAIIGVSAFFLGRNASPDRDGIGTKKSVPYAAGTPAETYSVPEPNLNLTSPQLAANALADSLRTKSVLGSKLVDAYLDPRNNTLHLGVVVDEVDDFRYVCAHLARIGLENVSGVANVEVHASRNGNAVYFAQVTRSSLEALLNQNTDNPESDPKGFADALLKMEWPALSNPASGAESTVANNPETQPSSSAESASHEQQASGGDPSAN